MAQRSPSVRSTEIEWAGAMPERHGTALLTNAAAAQVGTTFIPSGRSRVKKCLLYVNTTFVHASSALTVGPLAALTANLNLDIHAAAYAAGVPAYDVVGSFADPVFAENTAYQIGLAAADTTGKAAVSMFIVPEQA